MDTVPNSSQILKIMEVAGATPETADYFVERLKQVFAKAKVSDQPEFKNMLERAEEFRVNVKLHREFNAQYWSGAMASETKFKNLHWNIATTASDEVKQAISGALVVDVAISDRSEILRGFADNDQPIENEKVISSLDKLFNAWLVEHDMVSQDSTLYDANGDGEIRFDERGKPVVADPEHVKALITDAEKGLEQYLESKKIPVQAVMLHEHPSSKVSDKKAKEVEQRSEETGSEKPSM